MLAVLGGFVVLLGTCPHPFSLAGLSPDSDGIVEVLTCFIKWSVRRKCLLKDNFPIAISFHYQRISVTSCVQPCERQHARTVEMITPSHGAVVFLSDLYDDR